MIRVLQGPGELARCAGDSADGPARAPSLRPDTPHSSQEVGLLSPCFTDKETELEGNQVVCPKSHSANRRQGEGKCSGSSHSFCLTGKSNDPGSLCRRWDPEQHPDSGPAPAPGSVVTASSVPSRRDSLIPSV